MPDLDDISVGSGGDDISGGSSIDDISLIPPHIIINDPVTKESVESQLHTAMTTSQRLFIVAGVMDLTEHITVPSYKVNLIDGYDEWIDNNKVTHRDIVSKKAQGSFSIKFESLEEFQSFMIIMKDYKKQNGSYDCTVFCNNTLSTINTEMFIDFDAANVMPYIGSKDYDAIELTVTQRGNQYVRS